MATTNLKAMNDASDLVNQKLAQARGICTAISILVRQGTEYPEDAVADALWAAEALIGEADEAFQLIDGECRPGRAVEDANANQR